MRDYANLRPFLRSVPVGVAAAARRERVFNYVLAASLGTLSGVLLALAI